MQLIYEELEEDVFIEIVLTNEELNKISKGRLVCERVEIEEVPVNVGIRLNNEGE
jgi:hypothetical protein